MGRDDAVVEEEASRSISFARADSRVPEVKRCDAASDERAGFVVKERYASGKTAPVPPQMVWIFMPLQWLVRRRARRRAGTWPKNKEALEGERSRILRLFAIASEALEALESLSSPWVTHVRLISPDGWVTTLVGPQAMKAAMRRRRFTEKSQILFAKEQNTGPVIKSGNVTDIWMIFF